MAYSDLIRRGDAIAAMRAIKDDILANPPTWHPAQGAADCASAIAALPASAVGVKPLEWDRHGEGPVVWKAITALGTYFICDDTDDFTGLYLELVTHQNAQWWGKCDVLVVPIADHLNHPDEAELQAAAQADYESRIPAALQTKGM